MHLRQLVGGVRVRGIERQLRLECPTRLQLHRRRSRRASSVRAGHGRCGNGCPGGAAPSSSTCRYSRYRRVGESLGLVRFTRRLVQPDGVRRDVGELHRLQVGEVREQAARVVQHFGVVGVQAGHLERDVDGVPIPSEPGVDALQVQSGHAPQDRRRRAGRRPSSGPAAPRHSWPSSDSDMASRTSIFGSPGFSRSASRSGTTASANLPCWK